VVKKWYWTICNILFALGICGVSMSAWADHDFTIRGQFQCINKGTTMPVEGAIVGIMRDKSWAADPIVAEVQTAADGTFATTVKAKNVDTFYAKLFLNDKQGVYLRDWWTLSVKEINSANRAKNQDPLVDLGGTVISRNGGTGTPECAIWQGGRTAWQEFLKSTGGRPIVGEHGNYQIVMESTDSGIVWTSRDTTHWEVGNETTEFSGPAPSVSDPQNIPYSTLFFLYGTNIHEFGHAIRQTADGSDNHFSWDATRFFYGHSHDTCKGSPHWVKGQNDGYAFNEGWAEFWQNTESSFLVQTCVAEGLDLKDFKKEGAVANDLETLAGSLGNCAGIETNALNADDLLRKQRSLMFDALKAAGPEKIHSDQDFRDAFHKRFPNCPIPAPGTPAGGSGVSGLRAQVPVRAPHLPVLQTGLQARIAALTNQLVAAQHASLALSPSAAHEERTQAITNAALIRGQLSMSKLLLQQYATAQVHPATAPYLMSEGGIKARADAAAAFDRQAKEIALRTLNEERAALTAKRDAGFEEDVAFIDAAIESIKKGSNRAALTFIDGKSLGDQDDVASKN
jgi:hypothetical protein